MDEHRQKLLFVCGRNQWRSPTAERIFSRSSRFDVRGRGISSSAVRRLNASDILWADVILVMESHHKQQLTKLFRAELGHRPVHVLDVPDEYRFMDPELVELLETAVYAVMGPDQDPSESIA